MGNRRYWGIIIFLGILALIAFLIIYLRPNWFYIETEKQKLYAVIIILSLLISVILIYSLGLMGWQKLGKNDFINKLLSPSKIKEGKKELVDPLFDVMKNFLYQRFGYYWRFKLRKVLILGEQFDIEKLLPDLVSKTWFLCDNTLLIWGGKAQDEINMIITA